MTKKRKGYMTLAEHDAKLKAEGKWEDYIARKKVRDEAFQRQAEEYARAEAPLVQALNAAGLPVSSVWDLVNAGRKRPVRAFRISTDPPEALWSWLEANGGSYASILPLLLEHLQRPYPDAIRDGIARSLAVPEARFAWPILVRLYKDEENRTRSKQGLAVALSNIADRELMSELLDLICDPRLGESRILMLNKLERSKDPAAHDILKVLSADPQLQKEVQAIVKRLERKKQRRKKE